MQIEKETVTFNVDDPDQKAMYEHVCKRTNKSAYLKRLIWQDMLREAGHVAAPQPAYVKPIVEESDIDAMKAML